jgi:hypothetical protein
MCDPITIASAAMTAGSMVVNQMAANKVEKAREGAMTAENLRQRRLDEEATALNNASRDRYNGFEGQQDEKGKSLASFFDAQNEQRQVNPLQGAPTETIPESGNNVVLQEQRKQQDKVRAFSTQQAEALGNLRSFGDLLGDTSRLQARDAAQVGTIGGFKKGSQAVLPLELEAANNKGAGLRMFGDILGGVGQLGMGYGTTRALANGGDTLFTKMAAVQGPTMSGAPLNTMVRVNRFTGAAANPYVLF